MNTFLNAFLPLFVAMNLPGILPLFIGLSEGLTEHQRRTLATRAVITAFAVAVLILFAGEFIFKTMGITVNDLRVGGGLILLVLSISDLLFDSQKQRRVGDNADIDPSELGIVPLGIPLVIGPAAITTIIVSNSDYGWTITLASLVANLALVTVGFFFGPALIAKLGAATSKAIAKIASLFLAAISVAMIRAGILGMIAG